MYYLLLARVLIRDRKNQVMGVGCFYAHDRDDGGVRVQVFEDSLSTSSCTGVRPIVGIHDGMTT